MVLYFVFAQTPAIRKTWGIIYSDPGTEFRVSAHRVVPDQQAVAGVWIAAAARGVRGAVGAAHLSRHGADDWDGGGGGGFFVSPAQFAVYLPL